MKIGIYDPYLDDIGGGEKYMMTIASCLSKNNEVNVFWDNKEDLEKLSRRFLIDLARIKIVPNIFSKQHSFIERVLETKKYDCLIVLSDGGIPLSFAKKTFLHIQQPLKLESRFLITWLKMQRINSIFFNSSFTKSLVEGSRSHTSKIIYPPVKLLYKKTNKENIILHVGRFRVKNVHHIDDYKKQTVMIKVFKKMIDEGLKGWKFVLAVSVNDKEKEDFEKVRKNTAGYPIEFLINQDNNRLWESYNRAKIYWHASGYGEDLDSHPEYAEHFGISTVEAMGGGAVPVVINAGGQKEIVENKIDGFLWNTLEELEDRTFQLIKSDEIRKKMSEKAMEKAKTFSADDFCKKIEDLING